MTPHVLKAILCTKHYFICNACFIKQKGILEDYMMFSLVYVEVMDKLNY